LTSPALGDLSGPTTAAVSAPLGSDGRVTVDRVVALLSALAFIGGTALLVWLAEPPGVIVAIIAVVAVWVLLRALVPGSRRNAITSPG